MPRRWHGRVLVPMADMFLRVALGGSAEAHSMGTMSGAVRRAVPRRPVPGLRQEASQFAGMRQVHHNFSDFLQFTSQAIVCGRDGWRPPSLMKVDLVSVNSSNPSRPSSRPTPLFL